MVVFTCFEPTLPPEMVVNNIKDEYMSIFIFTVLGFFYFRAFFSIFRHFRAVLGILGILGVSVEIWGILGVIVSYKIPRGILMVVGHWKGLGRFGEVWGV